MSFRNAPRADRNLVERYRALKRRLAVQNAADWESYSAAKTDFVRAVLEQDNGHDELRRGAVSRSRIRG